MSKDQLYLAGERSTGLDVRTQNVTAALSVANVVKSSLGPVGLDKMLVDDVGEVTITNDGATILGQLEVEEHPLTLTPNPSPSPLTPDPSPSPLTPSPSPLTPNP